VRKSQYAKGAIVKLFGVILIFLGALDSMLAWRGGYAVSNLYVFLIAFGIFLYIVGAIRQGTKHQE
jgi:hypothetical protein